MIKFFIFIKQNNKNNKLKMKNYSFLTDLQKQGLNLGKQQDQYHNTDIINEMTYQLFNQIEQENDFDDEEYDGQSIQDFQNMEEGTNEQGTGRFRVKSDRKNIKIGYIQTQNNKNNLQDQLLQKSQQLLTAYFPNMDVSMEILPLELQIIKNKANLIDQKRGLQFPLQVRKSCFAVDVFSLFDVLVEYVSKKDFSLLAFIDIPLYELGQKGFVSGRACGDRVAVIDSQDFKKYERSILTTSLHEFMHTLGLDHCRFFDCNMNAGYDIDQSQLNVCPVCLEKLRIALQYKIQNKNITLFDINKRYNALQQICQIFKWKNDVNWLEKIQNLNETFKQQNQQKLQ